MSCKELQEEELEVLESIYEGDEAFKKISPTVFQYKVGDDGEHKSFLVEVSWGDGYPEELPDINLGAFYNKHVLESVKTYIIDQLREQGEALVGCAMTYSLFEYAKENADQLLADQPDAPVPQTSQPSGDAPQAEAQSSQEGKQKVKKEQLTKAQKRKMYNRLDNKGEKPRGWNWVDVVKHLSQTGGKQSDS